MDDVARNADAQRLINKPLPGELAQHPLMRLRSVELGESSTREDSVARFGATQPSNDPTRSQARRVHVRVRETQTQPSETLLLRFSVLQQWEGTVVRRAADDVTAVVRDLTDPAMPEEQIVVSMDEFSGHDQSILTPGTVFNWTIGYRTSTGGNRERVSFFQVRRRPPPSRSQRARAEKEARALSNLLAGPLPRGTSDGER